MSRVAELLARKRAATIVAMEMGAEIDTRAVDQELARVRMPRKRREAQACAHLEFSRHARRRMSQRGLSVADVYAIYRGGEAVGSGDSLAFHVSERALVDPPPDIADRLRRLRGCCIIVRPSDVDAGALLLTVLRDGEDTTFRGRR